jgi:cation:H+ antiporter
MFMTDFSANPLWVNGAVFFVAATAVWWAGSRLTHYADAISEMTGLGSALTGMLLLGGITSLPEIAVSVTASAVGSAALSVNNILGGIAMQVVIIAIGDAVLRRAAITSRIATPTVLLQAVFSCFLLALVIAGILVGDMSVLGVGLWSSGIMLCAVLLLWLISRYKGNERWRPDPTPDEEPLARDRGIDNLRRAILLTCGFAAVIVSAGYVLARTGEAIAHQSGLGESFVGATLVGATTSLPEISTVITAVRIRRYMLAFSDIFGTNLFDCSLIFLIDAVYSGPPVLNEVGTFSAFGALLGITVTLMYVSGLIERRDKTVFRLGIDSWAVLGVYLGGLTILYSLR